LRDVGNSKKSQPVDIDACIACRVCESQCPESAIQIIE